MKHYGDIKLLSGYTLPVVDVITGGSPCQDLSVAGKRAGLDGERSGLFMEQIRIVKEMRERDKANGRTGFLVRPRYCVWENVTGAFSSNGGKDFQAVLTEFVKIAEPEAPGVSMPETWGWSKSGCLYDEMGKWSIAWRVHDAQFWGVPQRRKRIALVADFGGLSAPEILFEREGLSGNPEPGKATGEATAGGAGSGVEGASKCLNPWEIQQQRIQPIDGTAASISAAEKRYGGIQSLIFDTAGAAGGGVTGASFYDAYQHHGWRKSETSGTLTVGQNNTVRGDTPLITAYGISSYDSNAMKSPNPHSGIYEADTARTPDLNGGSPACNQGGIAVVRIVDTYQETTGALCAGISKQVGNQIVSQDQLITKNAIVRRLTPLECERLQGYPDGWTDIGEWVDSNGKKHKAADSPRYKALGNSIALPFWQYLARRICAQYEREITMGSLFDGIGGFPLVFERCGAKAVWASEIEEFPIAVTKKHFPEV